MSNKERTETVESKRQEAMKWWNGLSFEDKWFEIVKNKTLVVGYPDRSPNDLTGREIEIIYNQTPKHQASKQLN